MSKRKKKKVSAYTRNRNRIMQQIRRIEKKSGFKISLQLPTERQLRLQGITGSKLTHYTSELKKIKSKDILDIYSGYDKQFDPTTGEIFSNEPEFEPPFVPTSDVSMVDRSIIGNFETFIQKLPNNEGTILLRGWKNSIISQFGEHAFAEMFKEADKIRPIISEIQIYKWNNAHDYISFAMNYLPEAGPITKQDYEDAIGDFRTKIEDYWDASDEWIPVL